MRNFVALAAVLVSLCMSPLALAQNSRIGFVNADRVVRESAPAARALKRLEKEFEKREQELQKMGKQLQSLEDSLEKGSTPLADSDRRNKEREFNELNREFQRRQREYREDRTQRQNDELAGVAERANRAIKQIAEAEHFDLILQEAVYFSPAVDITDKVLKVLVDTK